MEGQFRLMCIAVHFVHAYCRLHNSPCTAYGAGGFHTVGFIGILIRWRVGDAERKSNFPAWARNRHAEQTRQVEVQTQPQMADICTPAQLKTRFQLLVHFLTELTAGYSVPANQLLREGRFVCWLALDSKKSACSFLAHAHMSALSVVY